MLGDIVLTHDQMVEGVHFFASADPADVAWKLLAVNLSDLAAKGAVPVGVLLGYMLGRDDARSHLLGDGAALLRQRAERDEREERRDVEDLEPERELLREERARDRAERRPHEDALERDR